MQAADPGISGDEAALPVEIEQRIARVSELAALALGVERIGLWLYGDDGDLLRRVHLYLRPAGVHVSGGILRSSQYPAYFAALREEGRLVVTDARQDESARELAASYSRPLDIQAWIDQPFQITEGPSGLVRFEKLGRSRRWTVTDLRLAETAADLVSMILGQKPSVDAVEVPPEPEPGAAPGGAAEPGSAAGGAGDGEEPASVSGGGRERGSPAGTSGEAAGGGGGDAAPRAQGFNELLKRGHVGTIRMDPDGAIQDANRAFARLVRLDSADAARGRQLQEFLVEDQATAMLERLRDQGEIAVEEARLVAADDGEVWTLMSGVRTEAEDGAPVFLAVFLDITARKAQERELERQAQYDALTGLANRRLLWEKATQALALADRHGREAGVLYLDLTNFKKVNDEHGHMVGDEVLREVAARLQESLRESDVAARIGGDEFAVLLAEVEGTGGALEAARRIQSSLNRPLAVEGATLDVRARAGVAVYPVHGLALEDLLDKADQAMYLAKEKDSEPPIEVYATGPDVPGEAAGEPAGPRSTASDWIQDLQEAIRGNELTLHYQPIYGLPGGDFAGAEALVRWQHPGRGLLSPGDFLTDALKAGLWVKIDRWVLRRAIAQAAEWRDTGGPSWVSVNVSEASIRDPGLVYYIHGELERAELEPCRLVVEVAEDAVRQEGYVATRTLGALRELGVGIAIDRCGTSPSVRTSLRYLPADMVKVDLDFVQRAEYDLDDPELASVLGDLAGTTGARLLAEGVETAGEFQWARAASFSLAQGFYMARPGPPEAIAGAAPGGSVSGQSQAEEPADGSEVR